MNKKISLIIDSEYDYFVNWLKKNSGRHFVDVENGFYQIYSASSKSEKGFPIYDPTSYNYFLMISSNELLYQVDHDCVIYYEHTDLMNENGVMGIAFLFDLLQLNQHRLEVTASCELEEPQIVRIFERLIILICETWGVSVPAEFAIQLPTQQLPTRIERNLRRGGPLPTPDDVKLEYIRGWFEIQGKETQESYCSRNGISPSGLRYWMRKMKAEGKLPPS